MTKTIVFFNKKKTMSTQRLFRQELKSVGCGCCNAFCFANLWLLVWLLLNLLLILWFALMVFALYSPYDTVPWPWPCDQNNDGMMEECDAREVLQDYGVTRGVAIATLTVQFIICIFNIFGFIGLWQCQACLLLITIFIGIVGTIWYLVYFILAKQYYYIIALLVPCFLICFFVRIYETARIISKNAESYENVQRHV
eukprot:UN08522